MQRCTRSGVAGDGAGDDEYACADGCADSEEYEVNDAEAAGEAEF